MDKVVIRDFAAVQEYKGSYGPSSAEIAYGELTVDLIGFCTAEELLAAFKGSLPDEDAQSIVGLLLDADLTYDINADIDELEAGDEG